MVETSNRVIIGVGTSKRVIGVETSKRVLTR